MSSSDEPDCTVAREDREATGLHATDDTPPNLADPSATMHRNAGAPEVLLVSQPARNPGLYVPGFVVTGEIARGGMGVVLAAVEADLGREVAIKMLLPGAVGAERAARRFVEEARITARLPHPSIPPIHRVGALPDGRPFLVMKLIRGRTLAAILTAREQRPSSRSADELDLTALNSPGLLHIFEQICQAVGYAHAQGVIHRDLKPANVMVGNFGEVQVMDWGLAKEPANSRRERGGETGTSRQSTLVGLSPEDTVVGQAMGTPQYMPPEQARGEWEKVDARADVFALGGILCVILTGHPPYTGTHTLAVLRRAETCDLGECFARLDNCGADSELIELTKWCLAPSASDRPLNGAEIAQQLAAYRFGMETRLVAAESERAAAAGKVEEARLWAATEYMAKLAAEERAAEAELYADTMTAIAREQNRRRRGVFAAVVLMLLILSGVYGNFRAQKALAPRPSPCPAPAPSCESEAIRHATEHNRESSK
jgi:hypothetical protein